MHDRENELHFPRKMTVFIFGNHIVKIIRWPCSYLVSILWRSCYWGTAPGDIICVWCPAASGGHSWLRVGRELLQGPLLSHRPVPEPTLLTVQEGTEVMPELGKVMEGTEYACNTYRNQNRSRGRHLLVPIGKTWSKLYTNPNISKWRFYLCIST